MCSRASLSTDFSQIKIAFRIPPERPTPNFAPTWNLAPQDPIPIVRRGPNDGRWRLDGALGPDPLLGQGHQDPLLGHQRALRGYRDQAGNPRGIPAPPLPRAARRFYEWKKLGGKDKQPFAIALKGGGLMGMAGLWGIWRSPAGETVRGATLFHRKPPVNSVQKTTFLLSVSYASCVWCVGRRANIALKIIDYLVIGVRSARRPLPALSGSPLRDHMLLLSAASGHAKTTAREDLLWRISVGDLPYTSTKTELNRRKLPKPACIAISVIGRLV
jgi:hypothetical protein